MNFKDQPPRGPALKKKIARHNGYKVKSSDNGQNAQNSGSQNQGDYYICRKNNSKKFIFKKPITNTRCLKCHDLLTLCVCIFTHTAGHFQESYTSSISKIIFLAGPSRMSINQNNQPEKMEKANVSELDGNSKTAKRPKKRKRFNGQKNQPEQSPKTSLNESQHKPSKKPKNTSQNPNPPRKHNPLIKKNDPRKNEPRQNYSNNRKNTVSDPFAETIDLTTARLVQAPTAENLFAKNTNPLDIQMDTEQNGEPISHSSLVSADTNSNGHILKTASPTKSVFTIRREQSIKKLETVKPKY